MGVSRYSGGLEREASAIVLHMKALFLSTRITIEAPAVLKCSGLGN